MLAKLGSLQSRMTCSGASRSLLILSVQSGGNNNRHRRTAVIHVIGHLTVAGQVRDDVEIGGRIKPADEITAQCRPVMINDNGFHIVHVEAQGIPEEKNQQERHGKGQIKAPKVTDEVIEFLPGY